MLSLSNSHSDVSVHSFAGPLMSPCSDCCGGENESRDSGIVDFFLDQSEPGKGLAREHKHIWDLQHMDPKFPSKAYQWCHAYKSASFWRFIKKKKKNAACLD